MKKILYIVLSFVFIIQLSACGGNNKSSATPTPTTVKLETVHKVSREAITKMQTNIENVLLGYDTSISVLDQDGKINVSVYIKGGTTISPYIFGFTVASTIKEIKPILDEFDESIGKVEFYGMGDTRIIQWETNDLNSGMFMDLPEPSSNFPTVVEVMTYEQVLKQCDYSE